MERHFVVSGNGLLVDVVRFYSLTTVGTRPGSSRLSFPTCRSDEFFSYRWFSRLGSSRHLLHPAVDEWLASDSMVSEDLRAPRFIRNSSDVRRAYPGIMKDF